jgi:hypothetical protein
MITLDLRKRHLTIEELLAAAETSAVRIVAPSGHAYILESAEADDEFAREVEELGKSEKFIQFLEERRKEPGRIPLKEVIKRLNLHDETDQKP